MPGNIELGKEAQKEALNFLKANGYKLLKENYRTRLAEIDIIAEDKGVICFIEVKARSCADFGLPEEAVGARKQRQIAKAALHYLKENKLLERNARFDVISLLAKTPSRRINLIKNAFELAAGYTF